MSSAVLRTMLLALLWAGLFSAPGCRKTSDTASTVAGAGQLGFNEHIQPILSEYCYACHGPDPGSRKADLRLDLPEHAFKAGKSGTPVIPGKPDASAIVQRMESHDPKKVMPPPEMHKTMKPDDIARIRRWIQQGAAYEPHWAFIPPAKAALPEKVMASSARGAVESFVLHRLHQAGLTPSPEADRRSLIRRVTLDLIGLLPTPEEVDAFLADTSPEAYTKVVDRLLADPRYGEHRARYWLDYVRYADTHGIHFDNYRSIWPYRDYVIRSFNANKPFDTFTREQLAGDLLAPTNLDQIVATGYIRCNQTSNEGGGVPEEFLVNNTRDRVEAFGSAFLGLTVGCASCHDHKFDPITMKDFYQLAAFFNNTAEPAWDLNRADPAPVQRIPPADRMAAFDEKLKQRAAILRKIDERNRELRDRALRWLAAGNKPQAVATDGLQLRLRLDEGAGNVLTNSAPGAASQTFTATGGALLWREDWVNWPSMRMDINSKVELGNVGDFERDQPVSYGGWFQVRQEPGGSGDRSGSYFARMDTPAKNYRGWDILCNDDSYAIHLISSWPGDAIKVTTTEKIPSGPWHHVFVTYDGSSKAAGVKIYVNGRLIATKVEADKLTGSIRATVPTRLGQREQGDEMKQGRYQDVRFYRRMLSPEEVARLPYEDTAAELVARDRSTWTADHWNTFLTFYRQAIDPDLKGWKAEVAALDTELTKLAEGGPSTMIAVERERQPAAYVLARGSYQARMDRVFPDTPHFLPAIPGDVQDRRRLADWTLSATNPLTTRVVVNRIWQELFGTGLVDTPDDFGVMGARPTHPQLLDWLAVDFRENGWDVKRLYRELVLSAPYRQSASVTPERLRADPANRLLSRGPRHRVDAEVLRDIALQTAALLKGDIGGPPFKGYQPAGMWEAVSMPESDTFRYKQDTGDALYRRSLYAFWKRFAPPPALETFDAPAREVTCPRRPRTNTPLQALALMNEPQFVEASRKIAERLLRESKDPVGRVDRLAALYLSRPLDTKERDILVASADRFSRHYAGAPEEAAKLLKVGAAPVDPTLPAPDVAAWAMVASQVMNLDETVSK